MMRMKSNWLIDPSPLKVQLVLTTLAIYLHTFSEWLFFVTKPSFFSQSAAAGKLRVLLLAPLPLILAGAALVLLYHLSLLLIKDKTWRRRFAAGGIVIPAAILAGTACRHPGRDRFSADRQFYLHDLQPRSDNNHRPRQMDLHAVTAGARTDRGQYAGKEEIIPLPAHGLPGTGLAGKGIADHLPGGGTIREKRFFRCFPEGREQPARWKQAPEYHLPGV
jgi:uncharacterized iron-regulated membrane protein